MVFGFPMECHSAPEETNDELPDVSQSEPNPLCYQHEVVFCGVMEHVLRNRGHLCATAPEEPDAVNRVARATLTRRMVHPLPTAAIPYSRPHYESVYVIQATAA